METNLLHRLAQEVLFIAQQRHTPATQIQHFLTTYSRQASGWSTVWRSPQTPLKKGGFEMSPPF
jgi:hypothetical protein